MRADHARKLANLKRSKSYIKVELRLRETTHSLNNSKTTHLSEEASVDSSPQSSRDATPKANEEVDTIIAEMESALNIAIGTKKNVVCVDKGGFIEEQVQPVQVQQQVNGTGKGAGQAPNYENGNDDSALNGLLDENAMDADNSAASLLEQYGGSTSLATTPANAAMPHGGHAGTGSGALSSAGTPGIGSSALLGQNEGSSDLMDLDVEIASMGEGKGGEGDGDWVMVADASAAPPSAAEHPKVDASLMAATNPLVPTLAANTDSAGGLFDTTDTFSFDNLDTAGDALADYANADDDDLGLALEDSAFGDAFHGTEVHEHGDDE
jgi:hypothetical protein